MRGGKGKEKTTKRCKSAINSIITIQQSWKFNHNKKQRARNTHFHKNLKLFLLLLKIKKNADTASLNNVHVFCTCIHERL